MPGPLDEVMARAPAADAPEDHVDGRDLALRLDEHAAGLDHALGHVLGELVLRGDGIAEVGGAAGEDRRLGRARRCRS